ncbi:glycoside hydrolase superfamily [Phycomyces nitens]|nr:glycoside hydrolase superfamily [Phycomyces nitens]
MKAGPFIYYTLAISVGLLLGAEGCSAGSEGHGHHNHHHNSPAPRDAFVQVDGQGFTRYGKPYYVAGANYWQGMNLGADDCNGGDRARMNKEIQQMASMGINNLRVMASSEGPDDQPYRMRPSLMPSPGKYNEAIFVGLDYLLDTMDRYNMTAVMTMSNFWHWSGGFSQYIAWVTNNETIPYPNIANDWDGFTQFAARFYNDSSVSPQVNKMYRKHIETVQSRRNTVNGKIYREDPVIMSWQIANEPQLGPAWWYKETADAIKKGSPLQLTTTGIESKVDEFDFMNAHTPDSVDYCTCHCWVENWGIYNATDPNSLDGAVAYAHQYIDSRAGWANKIAKPIVMEEFGMARDAWKKPEDLAYKYDPSTTTTHKDTYYKAIYDHIFKLAKTKTFSGSNFWAYSGIGRSTDQPNSHGMVWLGDPPHEPRGWYGVYDKDSTVKVIKNFCKNMRGLEK